MRERERERERQTDNDRQTMTDSQKHNEGDKCISMFFKDSVCLLSQVVM